MTNLDFYWQENREWWTMDENWKYSLTDKAPKEAVESFERYQKEIMESTKDPNRHII